MFKPIIKKISTFDATKDFKIEFNYSGNQVYNNSIYILDNKTNEYAYAKKTVDNMNVMYHIIPANTLENGQYYKVFLFVYDIEGNGSDVSDTELFRCMSTPILSIKNISNESIIKNSFIDVKFEYTQAENDLLNYYHVTLYSSSKTVIEKSMTMYELKNYRFENLINNNSYFIKAVGVTVGGMECSTEYIKFTVSYITTTAMPLISTENIPDIAAIKISSNIISVVGKGNVDVYTGYHGYMYIILKNGRKVYFDEGFKISGDFTIKIIGILFDEYSKILCCKNINGENISLYFEKRYDSNNYLMSYIRMVVQSESYNYVLISNYINDPENNKVQVLLTSKNGIYDLKIAKEGDV